MGRGLDISEEFFLYLFSDIQHLKRVYNFLINTKYKKVNLLILFKKKDKNIDYINSSIEKVKNSFNSIRLMDNSNIHLFEKLEIFFQDKKLNIIIDKIVSTEQLKLCSKFLKKNDFQITFIEHNLHYHWEYIFDHKSGYKKNSIYNLIRSRNVYNFILLSYFSKIRLRIFERRINIFEIMKFGILNFADEVYVYNQKSMDYIQTIKPISNVKKEIIKYQFEFLPKKPIFIDTYNICIFSTGVLKSTNKQIIKKQLNAFKYLINFLRERFSGTDIKITIKFKQGEMINYSNIFREFDKGITLLNNIDDQREDFHIVVVPMDSFVLLEYLRSDVLIYTYNLYKNLGHIGKIAIKEESIPVKLFL